MNKKQEKALKLLELIDKKKDEYYELNRKVRDLMGDFPTYVQDIDHKVETQVVDLLDEILGEEMASYYLYEANKNGLIIADGVEYPIRGIDDVKAYLNVIKSKGHHAAKRKEE